MNWDKVNDFGHYGIFGEEDALYPEVRLMLQEELDSNNNFDTGWHGFKEQCESMRIQADQRGILIGVHNYMDEIPDLIFDIDGSEKLTDDQVNRIKDLWNEEYVVSTEIIDYEWVTRDSTVKDIMIKASDLCCRNDAYLEDCFQFLEQLVKDALLD